MAVPSWTQQQLPFIIFTPPQSLICERKRKKMAEGALFHLAGKVLELLGSLILQEVKLTFGVKTEIENLTNTVSTIQAVIFDAEKQSSHGHQIKDWLRKLKDVLHNADDLLDDFSTEVLLHKVMTKKVRLFSSSSNSLLALSPKMAHEIKAVRERLNAIAKDTGFPLYSKFP